MCSREFDEPMHVTIVETQDSCAWDQDRVVERATAFRRLRIPIGRGSETSWIDVFVEGDDDGGFHAWRFLR